MLSFICVVIGLLADQIEGSAGWLARAQVGLAAQVWAGSAVELARNTTVTWREEKTPDSCRFPVAVLHSLLSRGGRQLRRVSGFRLSLLLVNSLSQLEAGIVG
jgi:hypothetical protein